MLHVPERAGGAGWWFPMSSAIAQTDCTSPFYYIQVPIFTVMEPGPTSPRVNIFLLPSETTIFFFLTVFFCTAGILVISGSGTWILEKLLPVLFATYIYIDPGTFHYLIIPFIFISILTYLLKPRFIVKKERLTPLSEAHPEIDRDIHELASAQGISQRFTLMYSPVRVIDTYTFGHFPQYYIALSQGFFDKFRGKEEYNAVLYHEIAHIVNGDVDTAELSLSFLLSFFIFIAGYLISGLLNIVLRLVRYGPHLEPLDTALPALSGNEALMFIDSFSISIIVILFLGVVIRYVANMTLQYRELYADARAIQWLGDPGPLKNALTRIKAITIFQKRDLGFISLTERLFFLRSHPPVNVREDYIVDPALFSSWFGTTVIIGFFAFLLTYFLGQFQMWFSISLEGPDVALPIQLGVFVLVALLFIPKMFWSVVLSPDGRFRFLRPLMMSQLFALGFILSSFIVVNMGLIIPLVTKNFLFFGNEVVYNYGISFYGISWPVYFPGVGIIMGELYALALFAFLLIMDYTASTMVNCCGFPKLATRPTISFALLPGLVSLIIVCFFLFSFFIVGSILLALLSIGLNLMEARFGFCPGCQTPVSDTFRFDRCCPSCGYALDSWMRNV